MEVQGELKGALLERAIDSAVLTKLSQVSYNKGEDRPEVMTADGAKTIAYANEIPTAAKDNLSYNNTIAYGDIGFGAEIEFTQAIIDTLVANSYSGSIYLTIFGGSGAGGTGSFDGSDGAETRVYCGPSGGGGGFAFITKMNLPKVGDKISISTLLGTNSIYANYVPASTGNYLPIMSGTWVAESGSLKSAGTDGLFIGGAAVSKGGAGGTVAAQNGYGTTILAQRGANGGDGCASMLTYRLCLTSGDPNQEAPNFGVIHKYAAIELVPSSLYAGNGTDIYPKAPAFGGLTASYTFATAAPASAEPARFSVTYDKEEAL